MKTISNSEIENVELNCPITLETFRDPVIAKDGHVYERAAITRWIVEHGTSPITRQPLQVEELQPDEHLRRLAIERHNSTVSYNTRLDRVPPSTLQPVPPIITRINSIRFDPVVVSHQQNKLSCRRWVVITILILLIFVILIVSLYAAISTSNSST